MGHTPIPWTYIPNIGIAGPDGREIARAIVHCPEGSHWEKRWVDEAADNAEFIVQAVNAHEDLLAALEVISRNPRISAWFESYDPMALKQVRAAIGKARKEEPWSK